jgi:hypothetical protein
VPLDAKQVRVYVLFDTVPERPKGAWWFQYGNENYLTDMGGGNQAPFEHAGQASAAIRGRAETPPTLASLDLVTLEQVAQRKNLPLDVLARFIEKDDSFPLPAVRFRDGALWNAAKVERWNPQSV